LPELNTEEALILNTEEDSILNHSVDRSDSEISEELFNRVRRENSYLFDYVNESKDVAEND